MLGFLNPLFLLAAGGAAAAAVLLHALSRKKSRIDFSFTNLALVEEILSKRRQMKRIQDVLLAVLRAAAALLIVAAMAKPYLHWGTGDIQASAQGAGHFWLAFDVSYSMDWRQADGRAVLERSKEAARALAKEIRRMDPRAHIGVLAFSDQVHHELTLAPTADSVALERAIGSLRIFPRPTRQNAWVEEFLRYKTRAGGAFVFSDFSAHGFSEENSGNPDLSFPIVLIDAGMELAGNKRLHARFQAGSKSISASVLCYGGAKTETAKIQISDPESQKILSTVNASCGKTELPIPAELGKRLDQNQYASLRLALPADSLPADDAEELMLTPSSSGSTLIVDGEPGRRLNESESFYLRQALKAHMSSARLTLVSQQELSEELKKNATLSGADELWVLHPQKMQPSLLKALEAFLSNPSKKAVFSLGPQADLGAIESLLAVHFKGPVALTGARASLQSPQPGLWLGGNSFAQISEFELSSISIASAVAASAGTDSKIWLEAGGIPLLWEPPRRGARVFIFSSTLDTQWNNMAHKGFFQAMAAALAEEPALAKIPTQMDLGSEITLVPPDSSWKELKLISPSGATLGARVLGRHTAWGPLNETGFYELRWPGIKPALAPNRVAVSIPENSKESDLTPASGRQKTALLGGAFWRSMPLSQAASSPRKAVALLSARHLWRPMFLGAFLLLGMESLASLFFMRRKKNV